MLNIIHMDTISPNIYIYVMDSISSWIQPVVMILPHVISYCHVSSYLWIFHIKLWVNLRTIKLGKL